MKKCASCTKDLPDAALHCVFCGAKQPPAPATANATAKTAFGYSATDMQEQLRQSAAQQGRAPQPAPGFPPRPAQPPSHQPIAMQPTMLPESLPMRPPSAMPPAPAQGPALGWAPTQALPAYPGQGSIPGPQPGPSPQHNAGPSPQHGPGPAPYSQGPGPGPGPQHGFVPPSAASAKTMFVPGAPGPGPAPQGSFGPASPAQPPTLVPPPQPVPMHAMPMQRPMQPTLVPHQPPPLVPQQQPTLVPHQPPMVPPMPQPMAVPMAIPRPMPQPYNASQSLMQTRRPIDPWRDSLRAMMFIWGVLLLGAFATPLATSPSLKFSWNAILDGAGSARLPPLVLAAVGLLSVIVAIIPMPTVPRGAIATLLGLAGILVPVLLVEVPSWQALISMIGTLLLIPGLIIRSEYRGSLLPRVLVTLGALAMLLPLLLPQNSSLPVVGLFRALIDLPGSAKIGPALELGLVTIVIVSLLFTWMPAPVNGGAKLWAWLVILWILIVHVTLLLLAGHLGDAISQSPHGALVPWIYGGYAPGGAVAIGTAYLVITGYGLASVLGKQLE